MRHIISHNNKIWIGGMKHIISHNYNELLAHCDTLDIKEHTGHGFNQEELRDYGLNIKPVYKKFFKDGPDEGVKYRTVAQGVTDEWERLLVTNGMPWSTWVNKKIAIGMINVGGFCEAEVCHDFKGDWQLSKSYQSVYQFGILYHPIVKFVSGLKHADYSLATNRNGEYSGTYVISKDWIKKILENDNNWYMKEQIEILKNNDVKHIIHQDVLDDCSEVILGKDVIPFARRRLPPTPDEENSRFYTNLKSYITSYILQYNTRVDRHLRSWNYHFYINDQEQSRRKWNRWIDRHLDLEVEAWNYIVHDAELTKLLTNRYWKDFELGGFNQMNLEYDDFYY